MSLFEIIVFVILTQEPTLYSISSVIVISSLSTQQHRKKSVQLLLFESRVITRSYTIDIQLIKQKCVFKCWYRTHEPRIIVYLTPFTSSLIQTMIMYRGRKEMTVWRGLCFWQHSLSHYRISSTQTLTLVCRTLRVVLCSLPPKFLLWH